MTSFLNNSLYSVLNKITNIALSFITVVIIARVLGPEGQGKYSLLLQTAKTAFIIFSFGFPLAMTFYQERNLKRLGSFLKTHFIVSVFFITLSLILLNFFISMSHSYLFEQIDLQAFLFVYIAVCGLFMCEFLYSYFASNQNFRVRNLIKIVQPVLLFIFIILYLSQNDLSLLNTIKSYAASLIFSFLFGLYYLYKDRVLKDLLISRFSFSFINQSYVYAFKNHVGRVAEFLIYRVDIYIISYFMSNASIGLYAIAVNIVERLWMISESVSMVLFSKLTATKEESKKDEFSIYTLKMNFLMSFTGGIVILLTIKIFLTVFFGDKYEGSYIFVLILLPGVVLHSVTMMMKKILEARGNPGRNAIASVTCLIMNVILNFILIPQIGLVGAAVATSITYILYFFIQASSLRQKFNIKKRSYLFIRFKDYVDLYNIIRRKKDLVFKGFL